LVDGLWKRKGAPLLAYVERSPGPQPKFTKAWRARRIAELQGIIVKAYKPTLREWVRSITERGEVRFHGGIPRNDKALVVRGRLDAKWGNYQQLAYVSFQGRQCLKVGRSDRGLGRIANQWSHYFFRDASRVIVYFPKKDKKKTLPALECALDHLYDPFHSYQKPSERKYRQKCPACQQKKLVERLVRELFPI
jgi:hypothetical protein